MKLCKLKLKNLNSFRSEEELDFEKPPLDDASLVAITGPTGSGKTTLLDAICVALYGKTPRLTGSGSQNPNHLISHGETDGFAEVHFFANGIRYIAAWSCKLNASPKVSLLNADSDELITEKLSRKGKSLGSSENTVSEEITSILGLDFAAFKRSVMLAQGEFAAFLKASSEDRRAILEATASIHIYDMLRQTLNDKVNEVSDAYDETAKELDKIPDASTEQLAEAEAQLGKLEADAEKLGVNNQQIQEQKEAETKRKEDYEKLQSSEGRQKEFINQQPLIDELKSELEHADRANQLRPEKQAFDTAKSDHEKASEAGQRAASELSDAEKQDEATQADFDRKEDIYADASTERDRKMEIYADAKSDLERATDKLAEVNDRTPMLEKLDKQINTLSSQLTGKEANQDELQEQIEEAKTYLVENRLPSDRQSRLNRANGLLGELNSQHQQQEEKLDNQSRYEKKMLSLKRKLKKLSQTHQKYLAERDKAADALKDTSNELDTQLESGANEDWIARKQQAVKSQPIAHKYETSRDDLMESEERMRGLCNTKAKLNAELEQVESELTKQVKLCQRAAEAVQHCEEMLKSIMLANPINQFREHLHPGEPCLVCGATEHPSADVVEPEGEELLQNAENALADAKSDAKEADAYMQTLKTKQTQTEQNICNTEDHVEECTAEIQNFRDEIAERLKQWQEIHLNVDVSSDWAADQVEVADSAIGKLREVKEAQTEASHVLQTISQQFETCQNDIARETDLLNETEKELQSVSDLVEDLKADIASIEERFWELMPDMFHGITPDAAVKEFADKIKEVEEREDERRNAEAKLQVLNTEIHNNQRELEDRRKRHKELQDEINQYQNEGDTYLDAVREKADGLETEGEIDTAIKKLEAELKTKKNARDKVQQRLQECLQLSAQKQTAHEICVKRKEECSEKLEEARDAYFAKLEEAGFVSSEAHNDAFRDEAQTQQITEQINVYTSEKKQLEVEIIALRTQFSEMPFDKEILVQISTQAEEIAAEIQGIQQKIGAQQTEIDRLKDALKKRQELDADVKVAKQEWERWKKLQEIIPRNDLRDFALDIMFKQVSRIANVQLAYLTSDRYQLKVETIGKLTVIDRWNANEERPVETLSGGESFLTSLALALALSELSQGRAQLNSLFLDEGFGTLDAETLDIAIAALEGLRMQGRSIYLISHIQELTRRLPVKINVKKRGNGSSSIEIRE